MNCALAIFLPNFSEGTMHRAPTSKTFTIGWYDWDESGTNLGRTERFGEQPERMTLYLLDKQIRI